MLIPLALVALIPVAPVPKDAGPPLTCTVKRVVLPPRPIMLNGELVGSSTDDGYSAEVTLTNRAKVPLEFKVQHGLSDLTHARVVDGNGKELSMAGIHLTLHSIVFPEMTHTIPPGKSVTYMIGLFQDVTFANQPLKPGKYKVTAIFESGPIRAASGTIDVEFK